MVRPDVERTLVVHPHFHARFTGASRHVETVVPALGASFDARVLGRGLDDRLPRLSWRELWRAVRREQVIWHAHRPLELLVGLFLRWVGKDVRVVFTRHALGRPALFTRLLASRQVEAIAVSPEAARDWRRPAQVVGHGVDLTRFWPPPERTEAWIRLGLGGRRGVGVIGRVRPDKGQGDFIAALRPLVPDLERDDWRAVLVGLAKPRDRAWAEQLETGMKSLLIRAGERPDIELWYRALTLVVNPSHEESFGLTRAEALASGCCLVTTRLNAFDAMLEHGRTAFLYPAGDVEALREILAPLLREPGRAEAVGRNAAEWARSNLGVAHEVEALTSLYRALPGSRRSHGRS